jgi:hypothetical protein
MKRTLSSTSNAASSKVFLPPGPFIEYRCQTVPRIVAACSLPSLNQQPKIWQDRSVVCFGSRCTLCTWLSHQDKKEEAKSIKPPSLIRVCMYALRLDRINQSKGKFS